MKIRKEKIPEAWSAIADGRIEISHPVLPITPNVQPILGFDTSETIENYVSKKEGEVYVFSSDWSKYYTVKWRDNQYISNDNSTFWQSTIGYPIISLLILQKKLPFDINLISIFKDIKWKKLNTAHKNNYEEVVNIVLSDLRTQGDDVEKIKHEIDLTYSALLNIPIILKRSFH